MKEFKLLEIIKKIYIDGFREGWLECRYSKCGMGYNDEIAWEKWKEKFLCGLGKDLSE